MQRARLMMMSFRKFLVMTMWLVAYAGLVSCASPKTADVSGIGSWATSVARQSKRQSASSTGFAGTLAEALPRGCSTVIVRGLSEQIIAESNCLVPESYVRVPKLGNIQFGESVFPYLTRPARDALVAAAAAAPGSLLRINSMLRTVAQQYLLYAWHRQGRCGITLAAAPGGSHHESGEALDIGRPARWRKRLSRHGFRWLGKRDRWHFDYVRGRRRGKRRHLDIEAFQRLHNRNHTTERLSEDGAFGPATERALRAAPARGYPVGPSCVSG
jgi:hypothetical protein